MCVDVGCKNSANSKQKWLETTKCVYNLRAQKFGSGPIKKVAETALTNTACKLHIEKTNSCRLDVDWALLSKFGRHYKRADGCLTTVVAKRSTMISSAVPTKLSMNSLHVGTLLMKAADTPHVQAPPSGSPVS